MILIFCFDRQQTALHHSCNSYSRNVELCKLLLSYDADIDALDNAYHPCPRIFDSNLSFFFYCIEFLKFSFDVLSDQHSPFMILISCSDSQGAPLHYAVSRGDLDMCKLLLSHKANVNLRSLSDGSVYSIPFGVKKGRYMTPLHLAALKDNILVCEALISAKANMAARDEYDAVQRSTPLAVRAHDSVRNSRAASQRRPNPPQMCFLQHHVSPNLWFPAQMWTNGRDDFNVIFN